MGAVFFRVLCFFITKISYGHPFLMGTVLTLEEHLQNIALFINTMYLTEISISDALLF